MLDTRRKLKRIRRVMQHPGENDGVQEAVAILAKHERTQREQALALLDALDVDHDYPPPTPVDHRVEQLTELLTGYVRKDVAAPWLAHWGPDLPDDSQDPTPYAGLSGEEWEQQQQEWVSRYRRSGGDALADVTDRELVAQHVESRFGIPLSTFEEEVVGFDRAEAMHEAISGELETTEDAFDRALDALDERGEPA